MLGLLNRLVQKASGIAGFAGSGMILVIMSAITLEVLSRFITGKSVPGLLEISELLMASAVFLGLAAVEQDRGHIKVTMVTDRLSQKVRKVVTISASVATVILLVLLAVASLESGVQAFQNNDVRWGLLAIPTWPFRFIVLLGIALYLLQKLVNTVSDLSAHSQSEGKP